MKPSIGDVLFPMSKEIDFVFDTTFTEGLNVPPGLLYRNNLFEIFYFWNIHTSWTILTIVKNNKVFLLNKKTCVEGF